MNQKLNNFLRKFGKSASVTFVFLILTAQVNSCGKREFQLDTTWSSPKNFASSQEALNSVFEVTKLDGKPICVNGDNYYFLDPDGSNWTSKTFSQSSDIKYPYPRFLANPASKRFIVGRGDVEDDKLKVRLVFCSLDPIWGIQKISDRTTSQNRESTSSRGSFSS